MWLLLKNVFFVTLVPGTFGVLVPFLMSRGHAPAEGFVLGGAVALFALGAALALWCVWDFAVYGRGTPAPIDAPKTLVVRGPYRTLRNPMYVGALMVLLGWVTLYQTWALAIYAAAVAVAFHCFVVFYEEPGLRKRFGAQYEQYCSRVGRWMPKLRG